MGEGTKLQAPVDESGNFDRPSDLLCVGSVVMRSSPGLARWLRGRIRTALPHIYYPPHGAHLHTRSFHYGAWMCLRADHRNQVPPEFAASLSKVERIFRGRSDLPPVLLAQRHSPKFNDLKDCDRWLQREEPGAWALLDEVHALADQRVLELLRDVRDQQGGLLVAALRMPVPEPVTRSGVPPDRFLPLLSLYLERLLLLHTYVEAPVLIHLHVSHRGKLTLEHVRRSLNEARSLGGGAKVQLVVPNEPEPTDRWMDPGLVVADLAVNRFTWLARHATSWRDLLHYAKNGIGLPLEIQLPKLGRLPTVAFDGPAAEMIREVRAGRAAMGLNELDPLVREPTERWVAALKANRNGEDG